MASSATAGSSKVSVPSKYRVPAIPWACALCAQRSGTSKIAALRIEIIFTALSLVAPPIAQSNSTIVSRPPCVIPYPQLGERPSCAEIKHDGQSAARSYAWPKTDASTKHRRKNQEHRQRRQDIPERGFRVTGYPFGVTGITPEP